jgi:murein DD-endopeptidase MepM/ murein hydrolase activator NlpD
MIAAAKTIGKRLGVLGVMVCLTAAGLTVAGAAGTAGAAPTPPRTPNGVEVLSPQEDQTLASAPAPVRVRFNTVILPGSFAAELNGQDVTARFAVGTDTATASLAEADGIRISTDKNRHSNILHVWLTGADDPSHRHHDRRAFVVKSGDLPRPVSGVISPDGGTLVSPGVGQVTFPAGAFLTDTTVEMSVTRNPLAQQLFDETAVPMFDAANRLGYEVRITTGAVQPLMDPQVSLVLPDSFRFDVAPGSEVRMLAENYWDGFDPTLDTPESTLDTFELLQDRFLASDIQITATMPAHLFTNGLRADGVFELTTLAATTPTAAATTFSASDSEGSLATAPSTGEDAQVATDETLSTFAAATCEGSSLAPPLDGPINWGSPYGPRASGFHYGSDIPVPIGTPVKAMADGVIDNVAYNYKPPTVPGKRGQGWGHYVVIRHTDGSKTLYAHFDARSPLAVGQPVRAGDTIGRSGNSGGSSGPHLHIEYAPNGQIYKRGDKVDPRPCIGRNVTGSITVRDNGNLADDAFRVAIDGVVVCTTDIGASNTCAVGNLRPGTKTLSLTAVIAPDDVGTYEVILGNGLTFAGGGTRATGTVPRGGTASASIIVPAS